MPKNRLYNEHEISAVLKRAAELQRTEGPIDTSGLSLAELEQIAADVGIDPAFIKTAAMELDEGRPDEAFHFWGGPTSVELERIVEGEMSEAQWEEVVAEIRHVYEVAGETGQLGRTLQWVHRDQTGERAHVTLTPTGGQTRIRIFYRMTDWAVVSHVPVLSLGITLTILQYILLSLGPVLETGLAIFIFAMLHMLARLAFGAIVRRQERKARKLLTRLEDLIAEPETALAPSTEPMATQAASRIDAALLSDERDLEHNSPERRRARERE